MAEVRLTLEEYEALRRMISSERESEGAIEEARTQVKKKRKKVSKYHRELGIQWKKLKKKHPRTPAKKLLKRAHSATKKIMKKRR